MADGCENAIVERMSNPNRAEVLEGDNQPDDIGVKLSSKPYQPQIEVLLKDLKTDPVAGLTSDEVRERQDNYGANEIQSEKPVPQWKKFARQFKDVLVILLIIAAAISAILWYFERDSSLPFEAMAIFAIVLLNAILGYVQQARAEEAVNALRKMSAANASVIRDGVRSEVPSVEMVPGDIILIEEGDTVPADARLIESTALQMAESPLTGESLPVTKEIDPIDSDVGLGDQNNMLFSGTAAVYGRGKAVVTSIGMQTEMGQIAGMLQGEPQDSTPLQKELDKVGKLLGIIVVVIAAVMIATIIIFEDVTGASAIFKVLLLGVALAVAAVPEGLPAIVTAVLSMGVQRMARRKSIIRHLSAVETLGSANIIASDKTGTLTRNEMTVREVVLAEDNIEFGGTGYEPVGGVISGELSENVRKALIIAESVNNAELRQIDGKWTVLGDPTEGALVVAARKAGIEDGVSSSKFERVDEIPFSSDRKLMTTVHRDVDDGNKLVAFTKGAPDVLLSRCSHELVGADIREIDDDRRAQILESNNILAGKALRTLGIAFKDLKDLGEAALVGQPNGDSEDMSRGKSQDNSQGKSQIESEAEENMVFVALIGMIDPPREEAKQAVATAKAAGIRVMMITGDHPLTATVIARELGIAGDADNAVSGSELEQMSEEDLDKTVSYVSVYARVSPTHKLRLVNALQRKGEIVAMTGDGVNDAPALKRADIGVAMGITGTDVSKEAADMVLADDNFATIVVAVEEGRSIFANIRKFLRYLLSSNIGEVMTMFLGVLFANMIGLSAATHGGLVLPLLATQILWINLVTDGAPALALGLDPADESLMEIPPRSHEERAITPKMWRGIIFVGLIMAIGTLCVLDASLPGGFIEGTGSLKYGQTMAFTTLVLFQIFNVFNSRSDDYSVFRHLFVNRWLWMAIALSVSLQLLVVYVPFLQSAFSTVPLSFEDWIICTSVASSVLWIREITKLVGRAFN